MCLLYSGDQFIDICCRGFADKRAFYSHLWQELTLAFAANIHTQIAYVRTLKRQAMSAPPKHQHTNTGTKTITPPAAAAAAAAAAANSSSSSASMNWMNDLLQSYSNKKAPQSFSELCLQLPDLLFAYTRVRHKLTHIQSHLQHTSSSPSGKSSAHRQEIQSHTPNERILLLLRYVDTLDRYGVGMCGKLLQLSELTHTPITVVATACVCPSVCVGPTQQHKLMLVWMPTLTDAQLTQLVIRRVWAHTSSLQADALQTNTQRHTEHSVKTIVSAHMPRLLSTSKHPDTLTHSMIAIVNSSAAANTQATTTTHTKEVSTLASRLASRCLYTVTTHMVRYDALPIASTLLLDSPTVVANDEGACSPCVLVSVHVLDVCVNRIFECVCVFAQLCGRRRTGRIPSRC
jgi:hypothetical protein